MTAKKLLLARVLVRTGAVRVLHLLSAPSLVVLNYHRIRRDDAPRETTFEDGVFGPSASEFDSHMAWLAANTELVSEAEVIEKLSRGRSFASPSCLVTFDDGYVDNYETALPILRGHKIPATFFIPTGLIDSRRLGFWDIIAYLVKRSRKTSIVLDQEQIALSNRKEAIRRLVRKLKWPRGETCSFTIDEISEACEVPLPSLQLQGRELMTWDQIREVSRNGITIGSHTHTHPVLSTLSREAKVTEMRTSKHILEREIGAPVHSIAYPFGQPSQFGQDSMSVAHECGYKLGFSFYPGANRSGSIQPYGVLRFRPPEDPRLMIASVLFPHVFA